MKFFGSRQRDQCLPKVVSRHSIRSNCFSKISFFEKNKQFDIFSSVWSSVPSSIYCQQSVFAFSNQQQKHFFLLLLLLLHVNISLSIHSYFQKFEWQMPHHYHQSRPPLFTSSLFVCFRCFCQFTGLHLPSPLFLNSITTTTQVHLFPQLPSASSISIAAINCKCFLQFSHSQRHQPFCAS